MRRGQVLRHPGAMRPVAALGRRRRLCLSAGAAVQRRLPGGARRRRSRARSTIPRARTRSTTPPSTCRRNPLTPLPKGVPTGADACSCTALYSAARRLHHDGGRRELHADERPGRSERPPRAPDRQVAPEAHITVTRVRTTRRPTSRSLSRARCRRRHRRQHPRHRGVDRDRRHARVPDAPNRAPTAEYVAGSRHDGSRPRLLRRRATAMAAAAGSDTPRVRHAGRAGELHEPVDDAGPD